MKQLFFLLILWLSSFAKASTVDTILVRSTKMQKEIKVVTIVPDVAQTKRCPVVYLLHGHGGYYKTWLIIKPNLPELADEKGFIFVCPDGEESWYWDSPLHADVQYETFISSELVQYIDAHYPTDARRERRAISGLSMGGHGALWNAIRHPDVFGAAGSMSGGVDIRPFPKSWNMYKQLGERDAHPERPHGGEPRPAAGAGSPGAHLRLRHRGFLPRGESPVPRRVVGKGHSARLYCPPRRAQ